MSIENKEKIAMRAAKELCDGDIINLGIGLPTFVANYVPEGVFVMLQSENGVLGVGSAPDPSQASDELTNAGGGHISLVPGGSFFDSSISFGIIRGGRVDVTILGALQVDELGNIANWMVPGKKVPGMGGAMDLVVGARKVIACMEHTVGGQPKILKCCTYPLTAADAVDTIITEMAVIDVTKSGLVLREVMEGYTVEDVIAATEAELIVK